MRAIGVLWSGRGCRLTTNCCGAHKEKASERKRELSAAASEMAMRFTCVIMKSHKWRGLLAEGGRKEGRRRDCAAHTSAHTAERLNTCPMPAKAKRAEFYLCTRTHGPSQRL